MLTSQVQSVRSTKMRRKLENLNASVLRNSKSIRLLWRFVRHQASVWRELGRLIKAKSVLRKLHNNITKQALFWNLQSEQNRGIGRKQLEKISRTRTAANRPAMDPNWTTSSGQRTVEENCGRPMLQLGAKGLCIFLTLLRKQTCILWKSGLWSPDKMERKFA